MIEYAAWRLREWLNGRWPYVSATGEEAPEGAPTIKADIKALLDVVKLQQDTLDQVAAELSMDKLPLAVEVNVRACQRLAAAFSPPSDEGDTVPTRREMGDAFRKGLAEADRRRKEALAEGRYREVCREAADRECDHG